MVLCAFFAASPASPASLAASLAAYQAASLASLAAALAAAPAAARAAARAYQAGLRAAEVEGVPGVASKSLGDYSVSYAGEGGGAGESVLGASAAPILLRSEKELLNRYRCMPI